MNPETPRNGLPKAEYRNGSDEAFWGFEYPQANFIEAPWQYFHVCVPHYPLPVVRIVGYILRRTLDLIDEETGLPITEDICISYSKLIQEAGVSRAQVGPAIEKARRANFIRRVQGGQAKQRGKSGKAAFYKLRWDDRDQYVSDPKDFKGFAPGHTAGGHRWLKTPKPFFDRVVFRESLPVIKVVATVLAYTLGSRNQYNRPKLHAHLSYRFIQNQARMTNARTLSKAIKQAIEHHYIQRIEPGDYASQKAAKYAVKWLHEEDYERIGSNLPVAQASSVSDRFKCASSKGSNVHEKGFKCASINKKKNNPQEQQQQVDSTEHPESHPSAAVADEENSYQMLREIGFDHRTSVALSSQHAPHRIQNQINWLEKRNSTTNRLGLLRKAIEQDWAEPQPTKPSNSTDSNCEHGQVFARYFYAEYGENPGEPAAEPSVKEIAEAEPYVGKLLEIWPDNERISQWGRHFGRYVRKHQGNQTNPVTSFVAALRYYGNSYLTRHHRQQKEYYEEEQKANRQIYESAFKQQWLAYLEEQERRIRHEDPDGHRRFEKRRLALRDKISNGRWSIAPEKRLAQFDSDEERLPAFQEHFENEVLDFSAWLRQTNRQYQHADDHSN